MGSTRVLVVAGTNSGVGKTTVLVGILSALRRRGLVVQEFKVGPDLLDHLQHDAATGQQPYNLDGWLMTKEQNLAVFHSSLSGCDVALIDGMTGLFDSSDGRTEEGSTAQIAKWLHAPVVLVLDCSTTARSIAAVIKGYQGFDSAVKIAGVVLNKVGTAADIQWLKEAIERADLQVPVLGGVLKCESSDVLEQLVADSLDLDALLSLPQPVAAAQDVGAPSRALSAGNPAGHVRVAVAHDQAFCLYFQHNLRLLEHLGVELVRFSPLRDAHLPPGISGVWLGGGYPQKHASQLSGNVRMASALRAFADAGGAVYAECGGLLYLSKAVELADGSVHAMAGLLQLRTRLGKDAARVGYAVVTVRERCPLFAPQTQIKGRVHRGIEVLQEAEGEGAPSCSYRVQACEPGSQEQHEGYTCRNVLASTVHLHFGSCPEAAASLVAACCAVDAKRACAAAAAAASESADTAITAAGAGQDRDGTAPAGTAPGAGHEEASLESQPCSIPVADAGQSCTAEEVASASKLYASTDPASVSPAARGRWSDGAEQAAVGPGAALKSQKSETLRLGLGRSQELETRQPGLGKCQLGMPHLSLGDSQELQPGWGKSQDLDTPQLGLGKSQELQLGLGKSQDVDTLQPGSATITEPWGTPEPGRPRGAGQQDTHHSASSSGSWADEQGAAVARLLSVPSMLQRVMLPGDLHLPQATIHNKRIGIACPLVRAADPPLQLLPPPASPMPRRASFSSTDQATRPKSMDCQWPAAPTAVSWQSGAGRMVPRPAMSRSRSDSIVSFSPGATETLLAMGLGGRVAAITESCDAPAEGQRSKAVVARWREDLWQLGRQAAEARATELRLLGASLFEVDVELLRTEVPGLVVHLDCERGLWIVDRQTMQTALHRADLWRPDSPTRVVYHVCHSLADFMDFTLLLGRAAGASDAAQLLVDRLQARLRACASQVARLPGPRPRVLCLEGLHPFVRCGRWVPEMTALAGAEPWHDEEPGDEPRALQWDAIRALAPDVLIISHPVDRPERCLAELAQVAGLPGWWALPAVRAGKVFVVHPALLARPGPRLVDGVELLARLLHHALPRGKVPAGLVLKMTLYGGQRCRERLLPNYFAPYLG